MTWILMVGLATSVQDEAELGQKAYRDGRFAEAADRFEKALEKEKKNPQLWVALGHASIQAGRGDAAVRAYREAIALKAETADLHRALARALDAGSRMEEAIVSLRRAMVLDPEGSDALSIARLLIGREAWLRAEQELLMFLRTAPSSIEGMEALAFVLARSGRVTQAKEIYRELIRRSPTEAKYWVAQARLAASQGQYGEAIDALEGVRHLAGLTEEDERLLADVYLQEKMYAEAAACYARRLRVSNPPKADDAYRLGHAYFESGQWVSAREAFQQVLKIEPRHGGTVLSLGRLAMVEGNIEEARKQFAQAMEWMPESPQPALALGSLELKGSFWVKAAEAFREALRRGATDSTVWYDQVFSWHKAGKKDEAMRALREALHGYPFDERLRNLLQEMEK